MQRTSVTNWLLGAVTGARRRWYAARPHACRRLRRPVMSVGNVALGGRGKTPLVAHLAHVLVELGERPAILSRGYGRRGRADGVVVVRDWHHVQADLARAGDEPLMLARVLDGVAVLVSSDRYLAGRLAERALGCTVHLLDDGFQHVQLARDVDLVVIDPAEVNGAAGTSLLFREAVEAAAFADAVVVVSEDDADVARAVTRVGAARVFRGARSLLPPRAVEPLGGPARIPAGTPVLAVAGIARPERFFGDVERSGWNAVDRMSFRDHHSFSRRDVDEMARRARRAGAALVLTTEKDAMRLLPHRPLPVRVAWVPLELRIEPGTEFRAWLTGKLAAARQCRARGAEGCE